MANRVKERAASAAIAGKNGYSLISAQKLKLLYATMLKRRMIEQHLQLCARHSEEAAATAVVIDLHAEDTLILSPCSLPACLIKGVPLQAISAHLQAHSGDRNFQYPERNVMALSSCAATRLGLATGAALANKIAKKDAIAVVFLDAGSLDAGSDDPSGFFARHQEAFEIASAHALPILYVVNTEGAAASGFRPALPIITVDGHDVVAVYRVAQESIARARQGSGPTLIEHTSYRYAGQPASPEQDDAIMNMEKYLAGKNLFSEPWKQQIAAEFHQELTAAMNSQAAAPPAL